MAKQRLYYPSKVTPVRHNMRGGKGEAIRAPLLNERNKDSLFTAMSLVTLPPGTSIGVHVHEQDEEAYIILSGTGIYTSDEGEHPVGPGDIALCFQGEKHGLANTGTTDLVMAGIIAER